MKNLSFSAMIQFPQSSYYTMMAALDGITIFNSITLQDTIYSADMSFPADQITEVITAVTTHSGTIERIVTTATTAPVVTYIKRREAKKFPAHKRGNGNKAGELRTLLGKNWRSVKELEKETGWKSSTIHARFTGLRKQKLLKSKKGPTGNLVYRLKAATTAAA